MALSDSQAFERLLATLDWVVAGSRRHGRFTAWPVRPEASRSVVVYVRSGRVTLSLDASEDSAASTCSGELEAGDIAIAAGRVGVQLRGEADTDVIVTELTPARGSAAVASSFPELLFVRGFAEEEPAIAGLAASMGKDTCDASRLGDATVCARIATTIVAATLRAWSERGCAASTWLAEARDPYVARAISAIHDEPGRAWTVGELATVAPMSRSGFAQRFRELVGQSPASYLAGVRMNSAMEHLEREGFTVAETAHLLGYDSEDGFSRAFRRHVGLTPSAWRRERNAAAV